ncbi:MAG TPA: polysaccharide deacetylase family protein [Woeseiaceae bacterium]|nr:polysaccharide deacetylase family protein [Woeseiaceae bacterium]
MAAKLQILMYHRVLARRDPMLPEVPDAAEFRQQMLTLKRLFHVLPLQEAARHLGEASLPDRAVSITFDDGYRDNLLIAAPILRSLSLPASLFVASGFLDGGVMWNDVLIESARTTPLERIDLEEFGIRDYEPTSYAARKELADRLVQTIKYHPTEERTSITESLAQRLKANVDRNLMLKTKDLQKLLSLGIEIGAHTVNHPILTQCSAKEAHAEVTQNRDFLQASIQKSIVGFAYPNGKPGVDYDLTHRNLVDALGFEYAVSTAWGTANASDDRLQLPRLGFPGAGFVTFPLRMLKSSRDRANGLLQTGQQRS